MNTDKENVLRGYYHCVDCDALFQAEGESSSKTLCDQCGNHTTSDDLDEREGSAAFNETNAVTQLKRKKSRLKIISRLFTVILIVQGVLIFMKREKNSDPLADLTAYEISSREKAEKEKIRVRHLNDVAVVCNKIMNEFLKTKDINLIYDSVILESDIKRYYSQVLTDFSEHPRVKMTRIDYIHDREPFVVGALFQSDLGDVFEASFIQDKERYKIDWPFYVRYNKRSLEDFVDQSTVLESEFRLYMRVLDIGDSITLVFYPPKTNEENDFEGMRSFSLSLPAGSEAAAEIVAILENKEPLDKGYRTFTTVNDPKGCHRVRVRLGLNVLEGRTNSLELIDFIANDWYGLEIQQSAGSN